MISLGLGMPAIFRNPLLKGSAGAPARSNAEADYAEAISVTENDNIVPQPHDDYPDNSRPAVYQAALSDLDALIDRPPAGWPPAARAATARMRAKVQAQLDAINIRFLFLFGTLAAYRFWRVALIPSTPITLLEHSISWWYPDRYWHDQRPLVARSPTLALLGAT